MFTLHFNSLCSVMLLNVGINMKPYCHVVHRYVTKCCCCYLGRKYILFRPSCYWLLCPRLGGIMRWSASVVRPSDVAYIGSNSKTKRPRKTKLCTGVPQVTCDDATPTPTSRSKVKVTGRRHIVASTKRAATWRTAADITSLTLNRIVCHFCNTFSNLKF